MGTKNGTCGELSRSIHIFPLPGDVFCPSVFGTMGSGKMAVLSAQAQTDGFECYAINALGHGRSISPDYLDLRLHVVNILNEHEPTFFAEIAIDGANFAAKDTVDRNSESRGLAI